MALLESTVCLFCMHASAARLGLDKKGRPYLHCVACGGRSFMPSFSPCLNGIAVLTPIARAVVEEIASDRVAWERFHGQVATLLADLRSRLHRDAVAGGQASIPGEVAAAIVRPA